MLRYLNMSRWLSAVVCGLVLVVGANAALAAGSHKHQAGLQLLGSKINTDGKHEIHKAAGHTVYAHVSNKKIAKVSVSGPKGEVAVKKYKSPKKLAALGGTVHQFIVKVAVNQIAQAPDGYIGYAFVDPVTGDTYLYWYPADYVFDPSGAEVYVAPV